MAMHSGSAELQVFRAVSAELGADPRHVQGPGGNTSIKLTPEKMLIKASGCELRLAETENVFTEVELPRIQAALADGAADPLAGAVATGGLKPSIETTLHAVMRHRVVIHTHSIPVVALLCRSDARTVLAERLPTRDWVFVEYARPGKPLAQLIADALTETPDASVVFMRNHGIVVGAETSQDARDRLLGVVDRLESDSRPPTGRPDTARLDALASSHGLVRPTSPLVDELALDPRSTEIATRGTLYPDHVVFLGSKVGLLPARPAHAADTPISTKLWLEPGVGALLEPGLPKAAQDLARCLAEVVTRLPDASICSYLTPRDEAEILGMEEESYRQALARRQR
jgi:rhamnose utilization protein RhaD (predicted bifunctional aldolase and dehydrogenase)